jgi:cytochrome c556
MIKKLTAGVVVAGCLVTAMAIAQNRPNPDQQAAGYRQALMTVIAGNLGPVAGMARDRVPYDAAVAAKNVERVAMLSTMVSDAFARDTSAATLEKNEASPDIWKQKAEFDKLAGDVKTKADAALAAVKGGDQAKAKAALGELGSACGTCHDKYRVEKK